MNNIEFIRRLIKRQLYDAYCWSSDRFPPDGYFYKGQRIKEHCSFCNKEAISTIHGYRFYDELYWVCEEHEKIVYIFWGEEWSKHYEASKLCKEGKNITFFIYGNSCIVGSSNWHSIHRGDGYCFPEVEDFVIYSDRIVYSREEPFTLDKFDSGVIEVWYFDKGVWKHFQSIIISGVVQTGTGILFSSFSFKTRIINPGFSWIIETENEIPSVEDRLFLS